jgi:hypothetical protein
MSRVRDIPRAMLDHQGDGEGIAEVRVVFEYLDEGVIFGKQVGKDGLDLDVLDTDREYQGNDGEQSRHREPMLHNPVCDAVADRNHRQTPPTYLGR